MKYAIEIIYVVLIWPTIIHILNSPHDPPPTSFQWAILFPQSVVSSLQCPKKPGTWLPLQPWHMSTDSICRGEISKISRQQLGITPHITSASHLCVIKIIPIRCWYCWHHPASSISRNRTLENCGGESLVTLLWLSLNCYRLMKKPICNLFWTMFSIWGCNENVTV